MIKLLRMVACAGVMLFSAKAFALDSARTVFQFKHTAWTLDDGAPGRIQAIAQTKDGFLWLGTATGLYRFDGISFDKIPSFSGSPARSDSIWALKVARNGDVWVGHLWGGVSIYRNGRLEDANDTALVGRVRSIVQDPSGAIWVAGDGKAFASVQRFADGKWTQVDAKWGVPNQHLDDIVGARNGDIWFCFAHALMRLPRGSHHLQAIEGIPITEPTVAESRDGRVWMFDSAGIRQLPLHPHEEVQTAPAPSDTFGGYAPHKLIVDRNGSLWGSDMAGGVVRVRGPGGAPDGLQIAGDARESFSQADGLTSARVFSIFEDREGNIWAGTIRGLDRFRAAPVIKELTLTSIPIGSAASVTASHTGIVYGVTYDNNVGRIFQAKPKGPVTFVGSFAPPASALCAAKDTGVWLASGTPQNLVHVDDARMVGIPLPATAAGFSGAQCAEDGSGRVWLSSYGAALAHQLYRYDGKIWEPYDGDKTLAGLAPWPMQADAQGRMLMYFPQKFLVRIEHDELPHVIWDQKDISIAYIHVMYSGPHYVLLGGETGIARYDGKSFRTLSSAQFPFLGHINGIAQTARGETWLIGVLGIVRLSTAELDRAFDNSDRGLNARVFNSQDGLVGVAEDSRYNHIAVGADGRVWFITADGFFWIDPTTLYRNELPPTLAIRSLSAGGAAYALTDKLVLQKGTSNVNINYAALSLSLPERIRYRYRLDGVDTAWVDPGTRRTAVYTNLGAGTYRFRVIASNNDGVWNLQGATLLFIIPPTFLQSNLFAVLCVLAASALLWLLYTLRLRRITADFRARMEERLAERERIARDLHDTLLQGIDGLILRFQAITNRIQPGEPIRKMMDEALERADDVLAESRDSMRNLRPAQAQLDIADAFAAAGDGRAFGSAANFRIVREGSARRLHPIVRDEITKIGNEAIANAFRHANAGNIEVSVVYLRNKLVVTVSDDGIGMAENVLEHGRQGHFGLTGMRERAERIRAELSVASRVGDGTTVTLTVPASIAYVRPQRRVLWAWLPKLLLSSRNS